MLPSEYTPKENIITELFVKGHEPGKVSKKYDKLDPVEQLSATYDEDKNAILVNWDYKSDNDVSFEVSVSVNGGQMKKLSETNDLSMEISEVEPGSEYEIQVVVISHEGLGNSDAKTTKLKTPEEEVEEEEENEDADENEQEQENIPPVDSLSASYNQDNQTIDVSWQYNGPSAVFK